MTRAAFYAPMKPPHDPVPSGDREMARALLLALAAAGIEATVASSFRSRDGEGDNAFQSAALTRAEAEIARLIPLGRAEGWEYWITYHNYYKAPDLLGPAIARALDIPYVQIESTRARKRLDGPWARFAQAAEGASDAAAAVLHLTARDAEALEAYRARGQIVAPLRPFLARADLPPETTRQGSMLSVGMMRPGDKQASYRLIAECLALLRRSDWRLEIVGDGPTRAEVEAAMSRFGDRVRFLGKLEDEPLQAAYARAQLLLWPGVNEAFGMAYLEAQAAGLAVLAQDRPGVQDVLYPGAAYPAPEDGAAALAGRLDLLLALPKLTSHIGRAARTHIAEHHLIGPANATLRAILAEVAG